MAAQNDPGRELKEGTEQHGSEWEWWWSCAIISVCTHDKFALFHQTVVTPTCLAPWPEFRQTAGREISVHWVVICPVWTLFISWDFCHGL